MGLHPGQASTGNLGTGHWREAVREGRRSSHQGRRLEAVLLRPWACAYLTPTPLDAEGSWSQAPGNQHRTRLKSSKERRGHLCRQCEPHRG